MTLASAIQFLPYPEIVEDRPGHKPYTIVDSLSVAGLPSTGMVSKYSRLMFVPLEVNGSSTIRHELAHVRWSPTKLPKVSYDQAILLAVEDARINLALRHLGLAVEPHVDGLRRVAIFANEDLGRKDIAAFTLRAIASLGTTALPAILDALKFGPEDAEEVTMPLLRLAEARLEESRLHANDQEVATFLTVRKLADHLARELNRRGLLRPGSLSRLKASGSGCCLSHGPPGNGMMSRVLSSLRTADARSEEDVNAAEMFITEPPLPVVYPKARRCTVGRKASRSGALVRGANRWFSDKRIFRGPARVEGGTVLIDTSASMKLDAASVDLILRTAPGATLVAMYSGKNGRGELRVVARSGRRVEDTGLAPYGQGNLIDVPALRWLSEQPAPRIWLSDGKVTGERDWASSVLARQCYVICRRHGIQRVETAEEADAVLAGRRIRVRPLVP
ncbi:MAG TPA: hypothetical protein VIB38_11680 [Aestuariivirgaceae bacterium]